MMHQDVKSEIQSQNRIYPGIYYTTDLSVSYGDSRKKCIIPDRWYDLEANDKQMVTLHQRLAMIEALVACNYDDSNKLSDDRIVNHSHNYVTVNIGFVVSNKKHEHHKDADYKRFFITIPVDDQFYAIYCENKLNQGISQTITKDNDSDDPNHSERVFYRYIKRLISIQNIALLLSEKLLFMYGSSIGHKIYAIIFDIHTSLDMCHKCVKHTYKLQQDRNHGSFLHTLEYILQTQFGFFIPKEKIYGSSHYIPPISRKLHFVSRISSHVPSGIRPELIPFGTVAGINYIRVNDPFSSLDNALEIDQDGNRNIKKFANSVILHTHPNSRKKHSFYDKKAYQNASSGGQTFFSLTRQTIFLNTNTQTEAELKNQSKIAL